MRRLSRVMLPIGMFVIPFAVGIWHANSSNVPYEFGSQNSITAYLSFGLLQLAVAHVAGIPDETDDMQPMVLRVVLSSLVATGIWVLAQTVFPGLLPRRVIFVGLAAHALWSLTCSFLSLRAERRERRREGVVAVLADHEAVDFTLEADRVFPAPEIGFSVSTSVGFDGLGSLSAAALTELLHSHDPSLVVVSDAASRSTIVIDAVTALHGHGVKVRTLSMFYDEYLGKVSLTELTRMAMLFDVRNLHHTTYRRIKRGIDLIGALGAGLLCALVVGPIMLANVGWNRGPLLFRQRRVGLRGEMFTIVKFRTMLPSAEDEHGVWTRLDDPRVTPLGRLLRKSHLDELPQFWNILKGDLSLVGPRPEQPQYVEELSRKERAYDLRHLVTPGLTGWAQVKLRYADTEAAAIEKLQYDLYYLLHQSLTLDFRILSRTLRSVIRHRGR